LLQGRAGQPVELAVDVQEDRQEIAPLIPVAVDDTGDRYLLRGLGVRGPGPSLLFRELDLVAHRADLQTGAASRTLGGVHKAGFLVDDNFEMPRLAADILDVGQGVDFDVGVPADLDQLG